MNTTKLSIYTIKDLEHIILISNNEILKQLCIQELNRRLELIKNLVRKVG